MALAHVGFRTSTVKAMYRQGVNRVVDLQFLDDAALDDLLDDLLSRDKPPRLVPWETLEEMTTEVRTFGCLCTPARMCQKLFGKKPRPQVGFGCTESTGSAAAFNEVQRCGVAK